MMRSLLSALGFGLMAGAVRLNLLLTESRLQIVAFWMIALLLELAAGDERSWPRFALNGSAATAAIIAAKWYIEGVP